MFQPVFKTSILIPIAGDCVACHPQNHLQEWYGKQLTAHRLLLILRHPQRPGCLSFWKLFSHLRPLFAKKSNRTKVETNVCCTQSPPARQVGCLPPKMIPLIRRYSDLRNDRHTGEKQTGNFGGRRWQNAGRKWELPYNGNWKSSQAYICISFHPSLSEMMYKIPNKAQRTAGSKQEGARCIKCLCACQAPGV